MPLDERLSSCLIMLNCMSAPLVAALHSHMSTVVVAGFPTGDFSRKEQRQTGGVQCGMCNVECAMYSMQFAVGSLRCAK